MSSRKGEALFDAICKEGGEGIISKKAGAPYRGARTRNWLKIKCIQRQEFVIVGWSESDKRRGFRSLLLALREKRKLTYAGKVGTGFNAKTIESLMERMRPLEVDKAPLEVPRADRKGAHWLKPELVAEIAFTEFTGDGILRHPSFIALREDKPAKEVVREMPKHLQKSEKKAERATAESFGIAITNPDRLIFPEDKLTKRDLADYYAAGRSADHGRCGQAADHPDPLPAGTRQALLLPEARQRIDGRARQAYPDQGEGRRGRGLSLFRRRPRPARCDADGDDRIPRLGQPGRARSNIPTGWCSTSIPTSGSTSAR